MVNCKKLRYAWNSKKKCFVKLKGLEADVTKNELHDFTGYSKHEQVIKYFINIINYNKQENSISLLDV